MTKSMTARPGSSAMAPGAAWPDSAEAAWLHELAESLGNAIDAKDQHTWKHSDEVADVAAILARLYGLTDRDVARIHLAGHLHDIGKIGVADAVLLKPGRLAADEFALIRLHPGIGAEILTPVQALRESGIVAMVLHHHERWDGAGYPHGIAGEAIPLGARIVALADTLSAMLQDRPYRKAVSFAEAAAEIRRCAGTQFDPDIVSLFLRQAEAVHGALESSRARHSVRPHLPSPGPAARRPLLVSGAKG